MRTKVLLVLAAVAALGMSGPARADFTGYCEPPICVGVDQFDDGDFSGTFVVADTPVAGAFAGHEEEASSGYAATGACGGALVTGGCVVLFQDGDDLYLWTVNDATCTTVPLTGGTNDYC